MIGRLHGIVLHKQAPHLLLDVNGVGYEVEATMAAFYDMPVVGSEMTLYTHLIVRDDAHLLYGFANEVERAMFRSLIKISGVGAKLALSILSGTSVEAFIRCVRDNDAAALTRLPGVGKKTAERLIIEMRDRLGEQDGIGAGMPVGDTSVVGGDAVSDAVSALVALGYKAPEASRMVRSIEVSGMDSEAIIRNALQSVVKQSGLRQGS